MGKQSHFGNPNDNYDVTIIYQPNEVKEQLPTAVNIG
jgi:hypothetical protein